jgi:SAM-dependent methyltransferase
LSPVMLQHAERQAVAENLSIEWRLGDMRSFDLGRTWPLVIVPFNAFMHLYTLEDQDRALQAILRHLEPKGSLAFDLYVPNFGPERVLRHEGETFIDANGLRHDVLLYQNIESSRQIITTTYFFDSVATDGGLKRSIFELKQRYFQRFELERWLRMFDLSLHLYGDFEYGRFDERSQYMVVVAKRNE